MREEERGGDGGGEGSEGGGKGREGGGKKERKKIEKENRNCSSIHRSTPYITRSPTFLKAGAILLVKVPATIMTSACLGLARNTTPKLKIRREIVNRNIIQCTLYNVYYTLFSPPPPPPVYRSISYLGAAKCIISTAQHAKPKVNGHKELCQYRNTE